MRRDHINAVETAPSSDYKPVCALAVLTVRKHKLEGKNPIGAADLEWIFACNHEGLSLFFINIKTISCRRRPLFPCLYDR